MSLFKERLAQAKAHFWHAKAKADGGHHHHGSPEAFQRLQEAKQLEYSLLEMLKTDNFSPHVARYAHIVGGIYDLYDKPWTSNKTLATEPRFATRYQELKGKKDKELQKLLRPFTEPRFQKQPTREQIIDAWMIGHILTHKNIQMPGQSDPKKLRPKKV